MTLKSASDSSLFPLPFPYKYPLVSPPFPQNLFPILRLFDYDSDSDYDLRLFNLRYVYH